MLGIGVGVGVGVGLRPGPGDHKFTTVRRRGQELVPGLGPTVRSGVGSCVMARPDVG